MAQQRNNNVRANQNQEFARFPYQDRYKRRDIATAGVGQHTKSGLERGLFVITPSFAVPEIDIVTSPS